MSQKFCAKNKKKIFTAFFGVVFFAAIFWLVQPAQRAEAVGCSATCNNNNNLFNCGGSFRCFNTDAIGAPSSGGACSVGPSIQSCDPWIWSSIDCSDSNMSCKTGSCNGLVAATGSACVVKLGGWTGVACTTDTKNGTWDNAGGGQCIECSGKKGYVWGDSSGINYNPSLVFKERCGADAACDGKNQGDNCGGTNTCDANGKCVAPVVVSALTVSANPSTITQGTTTPITFTVTDASGNVVGAAVDISGAVNASCSGVTGSDGKCTASITAASAGTATATASKTGSTSGSITITVQPASVCPSGFSVSFGGTKKFSKNDNFLINYTSSGNFCAAINRISGGLHNFWIEDTLDGVASRSNYNTGVAGGGYVSTGNIIRATINNSLTCDTNSTCKDEIQIVECTKNTDCTSNNCNLSTNTCSGASPPPTGSVSSPLCQAALVPADAGKLCGTHTVTNAEVIANGWCCSAFNSGAGFVAADKTTCQAVDPACAAAASAASINFSPTCYQLTDTSVAATINYSGATLPAVIMVVPLGSGTANCINLTSGGGSASSNLDASGSWRADIRSGTCSSTGAVKASSSNITVQPTSCGGSVTPPPTGPCASGRDNYRSPLSYCSIQDLIQGATGWVLGLVSSIVILFLVYGGIMYTMAAGDETKMESAKNIIYYAILGLAIILVSYTLITEVKTILKVK